MKLRISILAALCASLALSACATKDPEALAQNDPWEPTNRAVFDFDIKLDHAVATPVAKFYNHAVPEPARDGIHNALTNLNSPVVFGNNVLQGEPGKAVNTFGRFVINSTVGVAGLIDDDFPPHASFEVTRLRAGKIESLMPLVRKYQMG